MIHNETIQKADETYEIRHDNSGNAIHVIIKDGDAIVYPTLRDMIMHKYFAEDTERFYCTESELDEIYQTSTYDYREIKGNYFKNCKG